MPWKMYLVEPTELFRRSLRRYGKPHDQNHYHDASVVIDEQFHADPGLLGLHGRGTLGDAYRSDLRWPKACACGYVFVPEDHWQMNEERLWKGALCGRLYVLREHPPGATWAADWFPDEGPNGEWTGPDGKVWCVMMPGGVEFIVYAYPSQDVDGKRVKGPKWTVTGTPPEITVQPSINITGHYHGYITGGIVSEDHEGRKYEGVPRTA